MRPVGSASGLRIGSFLAPAGTRRPDNACSSERISSAGERGEVALDARFILHALRCRIDVIIVLMALVCSTACRTRADPAA